MHPGHANVLQQVAFRNPYAAAGIGRASRNGRAAGRLVAARAAAIALRAGRKWAGITVHRLGGGTVRFPGSTDMTIAAFIRKYNSMVDAHDRFPHVFFVTGNRPLISTMVDFFKPLGTRTLHATLDLGSYHRMGLNPPSMMRMMRRVPGTA